MLEIKTTGFSDYLDGSANIKALLIGGPGAGKTRSASFWPKPFFIDCEDGRGSIADRAVPYVRVRTSKDMLDALEYLKGLESTPKAQRRHQTVVVDTADSFQRIVKDEWVTQTKAGSFSGFDAWGYLDTKMQLLFTRLLNLDFNVVVLVHFKDKTYKDGDNTIRELTLQLQGAIAEQVFNDFGLVGWMGTYWEAEGGERVQKRGLTFRPTPEKPFLKDRFHVTPPWMQITFTERDYDQLFEAFMSREDIETIPEASVAGEVPDSEAQTRPAAGSVNAPAEGGPLPPRPPAEAPLDKMLKGELETVAKGLGITVRGNMLKAELISSIEAARAAQTRTDKSGDTPASPTPPPSSSDASSKTDETSASATAPTASSDTSTPSEKPASPSSEPDPWKPPAEGPKDDGQAEIDLVADQLGGEVISEEKTEPAPAPPAKAPQGPSACADCGADLTEHWNNPASKQAMRMGFIKHRRYLCPDCNAKH